MSSTAGTQYVCDHQPLACGRTLWVFMSQ